MPAPAPAQKFGHRYPWEDWLAAPLPLALARGVDFPDDVEPQSMSIMLRGACVRAGLARTIRVHRDRVVMDVRTRDRRVAGAGR